MGKRRGYGQFCPVAQASEVFAERWTPLILRELLAGSRHFNDIRRGVPLISPSLLSDRLTRLERAGLITRTETGERSTRYDLTPAGAALRPIVEQLGVWGRRWLQHELSEEDLDAGLLMWDLRRRVPREALPDQRVVVEFRFPDAAKGKRVWWLVLEPSEVDLCLRDPGHEIDLIVGTDVRTMTRVWLGDETLEDARRSGRLEVTGPADIAERLNNWLGRSVFAGVARRDADPVRGGLDRPSARKQGGSAA